MRGIPVTVLGCPFYACWGLTDDRQPNPRRKRKLTIAELFAGAYLLYARYYNPVTAEEITFEQCLLLASTWRENGMPESRIAPPDPLSLKASFQLMGPYGILSWRYVLTQPLAWLIARLGNHENASEFKRNPIVFFRELSDPRFRKLGKIIYPWDS